MIFENIREWGTSAMKGIEILIFHIPFWGKSFRATARFYNFVIKQKLVNLMSSLISIIFSNVLNIQIQF